jgi:hypothetical protein
VVGSAFGREKGRRFRGRFLSVTILSNLSSCSSLPGALVICTFERVRESERVIMCKSLKTEDN